MEHLVWPVLRSLRSELGESGDEARVAHELRCHDVVGVATRRGGCDHDARAEASDHAREAFAGGWIVGNSCIRQIEILSGGETQDLRRAARLGRSRRGRPACAHLTLREIDDSRAISLACCLDQRAATRELDVVAMRGDGEEINIRHCVWRSALCVLR